MGCDIHLVVERKVGDKWVCIDTMRGHRNYENKSSWPLAHSRNYTRFNELCSGVRGDGSENPEMGIPEDASDTARYYIERDGCDGHSHSYMDIEKAAKIFINTQYNPDDYAKKYPLDAFFGLEDDDIKDAPHRIVFWFDN